MRNLFAPALTFGALTIGAASPALAAPGAFISLGNTNFIVLLAFLLFVGVLIYLKVPGLLTGALDDRAEAIQVELDEARALRDEAQAVLASFERKHKEVQDQADRIVAHARDDAAIASEQAKADLQSSIERRLAAAVDQIASAEAAAIRDVRDQAIAVAVAAANQVIAKQMTAARGNKLIDEAIGEVEAKLH